MDLVKKSAAWLQSERTASLSQFAQAETQRHRRSSNAPGRHAIGRATLKSAHRFTALWLHTSQLGTFSGESVVGLCQTKERLPLSTVQSELTNGGVRPHSCRRAPRLRSDTVDTFFALD